MPRSASQTRQRILKAAASLFSLHGYDGTTVDDILEATGITKGALYYYFASKEALCRAVIEEAVREVRNLVDPNTEHVEGLDAVRELLSNLLERSRSGRWIQGRLLVRLSMDAMHLHPRIQKSLRGFWQWHIGWLRHQIEQGRRAGQLSDRVDADTYARALSQLWSGAILMAQITGPGTRSPSSAIWLLDILGQTDLTRSQDENTFPT